MVAVFVLVVDIVAEEVARIAVVVAAVAAAAASAKRPLVFSAFSKSASQL